ncbi:amino acid transporter [Formosimonas limnophila]|uniref:Amino acid transporter n=1 Tax=Formosimonas limnophila TaxID=1384487 RepID=A0A8J3FZT3_9BURK|nr:amino acid ABC transporter permease [Formosimonas limnophila]GHA77182.1 amino acid transporter [Formosimonas limnophila]
MANDWGVFCSPGNEYVDKASWAESLCKMAGAGSYDSSAESVTWLQIMVSGLQWHFVVFLLALVLAFALGSLLGVIRTTPNKWLVRLGNSYVELFRNIPLIIQLFFWARVFPEFLPTSISAENGSAVAGAGYKQIVNTMPWVVAGLGIGLYHAARISEQVRAGIQAIPTGQWNAGFAMGMSRAQVYLYTILPVAFRTVWPTLTSEVMNLFKNTSVAFAIGVFNLYFYTKNMNEETSQDLVIMTVTTLVYLFFTYAIKFLMAIFEKRLAIPGLSMGGK